MKTKLFSLFILVALFAFAKPTSAQGFQNQTIAFDLYSAGSAIEYDHYGVYARVITIDGIIGEEKLIASYPINTFPATIPVVGLNVQVWVPIPIQTGYYRIGVAVVGMNSSDVPQAVVSTGASQWCNAEDLNSGDLLIKTN